MQQTIKKRRHTKTFSKHVKNALKKKTFDIVLPYAEKLDYDFFLFYIVIKVLFFHLI